MKKDSAQSGDRKGSVQDLIKDNQDAMHKLASRIGDLNKLASELAALKEKHDSLAQTVQDSARSSSSANARTADLSKKIASLGSLQKTDYKVR